MQSVSAGVRLPSIVCAPPIVRSIVVRSSRDQQAIYENLDEVIEHS